ncbi:hypothetical protein Tco_0300078, partial [Tanacetum coccineum]
ISDETISLRNLSELSRKSTFVADLLECCWLAGMLAHLHSILVVPWAAVAIWVVEALDPTIEDGPNENSVDAFNAFTTEFGFEKPSLIYKESIHIALTGSDTPARAKNGTGNFQ